MKIIFYFRVTRIIFESNLGKQGISLLLKETLKEQGSKSEKLSIGVLK